MEIVIFGHKINKIRISQSQFLKLIKTTCHRFRAHNRFRAHKLKEWKRVLIIP